MKKGYLPRYITRSAIIAALYAVLTLIAPIPLGALGIWQVRVSEAMTLLPLFMPEAIPGLFVGCLAANIMSMNIFDIVFGSAATLAAAYLTSLFNGKKTLHIWLSPLPPVLVNAVTFGFILTFTMTSETATLPLFLFNTLTVGVGEAVACYALGIPLIFLLKRLGLFGKKHRQDNI